VAAANLAVVSPPAVVASCKLMRSTPEVTPVRGARPTEISVTRMYPIAAEVGPPCGDIAIRAVRPIGSSHHARAIIGARLAEIAIHGVRAIGVRHALGADAPAGLSANRPATH